MRESRSAGPHARLCASRGRGRQQQLFNGVRDASAILGREVKPVVPTNMLQDAAKAARGEGGEKGDARDMAAMAAAIADFKKTF